MLNKDDRTHSSINPIKEFYDIQEETVELLRELHGVDITTEEFREFQSEFNKFHFKLKTEHSIRLSQQGIDYIPDVEDTAGQGIGAAIGIAIGVALSFTGIGSAVGLLTLVAIGASIGYQIGGLVDPPNIKAQNDNKNNKQKEARNAYGFDSVSSLVEYGSPIPAIYTNRSINSNGGVRTTGFLVNQRVDTKNGAQRLFQLYAICTGPIGEIDESETLLDNQSISTFFRNEITQEFRLGYEDQTPIADFPNYSNAVSLSANQTCGCDLRSLVESTKIKRRDILAEPELMRNGFDATRRSKTIDFQKNGGTYALFVSEEALKIRDGKRDSGFAEGTVLRPNVRHIIGLCTTKDPAGNFATIPFAFETLENGTWRIIESGVAVGPTGTTTRSMSFAVEYLGRSVVYRVEKNVVYTSTLQPIYPARLCVFIYDGSGDADGVRVNKLYFGKSISYAKGRIRPSDSTIIEVSEDDIEKFTPSDIYRVRGKRFQIVGKNTNNNTIVVDDVLNLREEDEIYAIWEASFETSRKVNRIDVNLASRLWARNPRGELIRHGIVFDVFIKADGQAWQYLQRFYLSNNVDVDIRRAFKIKNLPLNYYQVELRPVEKPNDSRRVDDDDHGIVKLGESGDFESWNVGTIGANAISIEAQIEDQPSLEAIQKACDFEGLFDDPDDDVDMDEDELKGRKRSVCTQQGPVMRITTINEIVAGGPNAYPGIALIKLVLKASERLTSSPTPSFLITKGTIDRIHLAAGTTSNTSVAENTFLTMTDLTASFLDDGIQIGDVLRNLDEYTESAITAFTATSVTTAATLSFTKGDRYLVYRRDSSCYFPDIYASRLGASYGLGVIFNCDEFLDYPAIVYARRFCINRRFFWDGKIKESQNINEWAQQEAPASLLICSIIDGLRSLVCEEYTPPQMLFNAANATEWSESYIDFTKRLYNRVVVTFTDGNDDYKLKTTIIETPDAFHKRVQPYELTSTLLNITYRQQAQYAGALLLKSKLIQDKVAGWNTSLYGAYVKPGGLVHAQHTVTEWLDERSGYIRSVSPSGSGWSLEVDAPVETSVTRSAFRATIQYRATGRTDYDLFCELNADAVVGKVFVAGTTEEPKPGDLFAVGEDREERRTFRVSGVEPTDAIGQLQISAIYWNKDILSLNNLFIDGVCFGGASSYVFDADEIRSFLAGQNQWWQTYTRNVKPSVMNANNLIANSFHDVAGRQGYFPPTGGTSETQYLTARTCAFVFQVTGITAWRDRAIAITEAAVANLYRTGTPSNADPFPHWLFNVRESFPTKGRIASEPLNYGYFSIQVTFNNGLGVIPTGGVTNGQNLSDVYLVYSNNGQLLWKNVYTGLVSGDEYEVNYWVSNYYLKGQNYRIYPSTASSSGAIPTVTAETAGTIRLTTNFTGTLRLVYAAYEPTVTIASGEKFEAYPMLRKLQIGEIGCATDVLEWADQTYDRLFTITRDQKWLTYRNATRYGIQIAADIQNLSHYYRPSTNYDEPFDYPGSQLILSNPAESVTVTRENSGDKQTWLRVTATNSPQFSTREIQNFAVKTQFQESVRVRVETAHSESTMMEIALSTSEDAFNFNFIYTAYLLVPGGGTIVRKTFEADDFIRWKPATDIVWFPRVVDNPIYTYSGSGGTITAVREQISLGGTSPVVYRVEMDKNNGFCGFGFVISESVDVSNPPCFYLKHEGDAATLRLTDGSGNRWDYSINESTGWQRLSPSWNDFNPAISGQTGSEPNTTDPIQNIEIEANGESVTQVYWISKNASTSPEVLPLPTIVHKAALVDRNQGAHTFWCGVFRPLENPLDALPYKGILSFTANSINGVLEAWKGAPIVGYQCPQYYTKVGDRERAKNVAQFFSDSQDAYYAQSTTSPKVDGPFAPGYLWDLWDTSEHTRRGNSPWSWDLDDSNSMWEGYAHRAITAISESWYLNPNDATAARVTMRFLTWIKSYFDAQGNGRPPTLYEEFIAPRANYNTPHGAALLLRSAIYANLAGGDPTITFEVIRYSYEWLKTQRVSNAADPMFGSFSLGQPTFVEGGITYRESFSFWESEISYTLALLLQQKDNLRQPCG